MEFTVIDKKTGKQADVEKIALTEEWAKGLCYCDIDGFAVTECGDLIMLDDCGRCEYAPEDRFEVRFVERTCHNTEDGEGFFRCSKCGCCVLTADEQGPTIWRDRNPLGVRYCPNCWARVVEVER